MTREQFKYFATCIYNADCKGNGEADLAIVAQVRVFDPKLAAMIQTLGETKLAVHSYLEKKQER